MLVDVIDLRDQPDACAEEHRAEHVQPFHQAAIRIGAVREHQCAPMRREERGEHQHELHRLGELLPVVGEKENHA